jgi:hypothetical protein
MTPRREVVGELCNEVFATAPEIKIVIVTKGDSQLGVCPCSIARLSHRILQRLLLPEVPRTMLGSPILYCVTLDHDSSSAESWYRPIARERKI